MSTFGPFDYASPSHSSASSSSGDHSSPSTSDAPPMVHEVGWPKWGEGATTGTDSDSAVRFEDFVQEDACSNSPAATPSVLFDLSTFSPQSFSSVSLPSTNGHGSTHAHLSHPPVSYSSSQSQSQQPPPSNFPPTPASLPSPGSTTADAPQNSLPLHFYGLAYPPTPPQLRRTLPPAAIFRSAANSRAPSTAPSTAPGSGDEAGPSLGPPVMRPDPASVHAAELRIEGVPDVGAKSRVETQIKVKLDLLAQLKEGASEADRERLGSWGWLRLPYGTAAKKRTKKGCLTPQDVLRSETLYLETAVVCASDPSQPVLACSSCRQRERKRSQRKKDARIRPQADSDDEIPPEGIPPAIEEQGERNKIVLFNCGELLPFSDGEVSLPTRITCYCRHHREKTGFHIIFTIKNHVGRTLASARTPPIMITDDHKSSTVKVTQPDGTVEEKPRARRATARSKRGASEDGTNESPAGEDKKPYVTGKDAQAAREKRKASQAQAQQSAEAGPSTFPSIAASSRSAPSSAPTPAPAQPPATPTSVTHIAPAALSAPHSRQGSDMTTRSNDTMSFLASSAGSPDVTMNDASSSAYGSPASGIEESFASLLDGGLFTPDAASAASPFSFHSPASTTTTTTTTAAQSRRDGSSDSVALASALFASWQQNQPSPPRPPPRISRLIPGEGPMHGGVEVTVLGEHFVDGLTVVFGDSPATSTTLWSPNTLVCLLPPSPSPGPVVVTFKGTGFNLEASSLQLFTYLDETDRALMELALQVVGLKMTGRIEDAKNIAMRIVGSSAHSSLESGSGSSAGGNTLADQQRRAALAEHLLAGARNSASRDFQGAIVKSIELLDVELQEMPGSAPVEEVISQPNKQGQTLLHLAAILGFHKLVSVLLARGVDIDKRDASGFTALHFAGLHGRVAVARLLLEAGADQCIVNCLGQSALEVARLRDQVDVAELLSAPPLTSSSSEATITQSPQPVQADIGVPTDKASIDADNPSSNEDEYYPPARAASDEETSASQPLSRSTSGCRTPRSVSRRSSNSHLRRGKRDSARASTSDASSPPPYEEKKAPQSTRAPPAWLQRTLSQIQAQAPALRLPTPSLPLPNIPLPGFAGGFGRGEKPVTADGEQADEAVGWQEDLIRHLQHLHGLLFLYNQQQQQQQQLPAPAESSSVPVSTSRREGSSVRSRISKRASAVYDAAVEDADAVGGVAPVRRARRRSSTKSICGDVMLLFFWAPILALSLFFSFFSFIPFVNRLGQLAPLLGLPIPGQ